MERLSARDFAEILADYRLDPWGDDWQRSAMVAETYVNAHRKKGEKQFDGDLLIPRHYRQAKIDGDARFVPDAAAEQHFRQWFAEEEKLQNRKHRAGRETEQGDQHGEGDKP